jgi:hypothetical protein
VIGHISIGASHAAAVALGAVDDGAPDFCPEYGDDSFAAFVEDFDGYRLEAKAVRNGPAPRRL